jgi:hypothetical protein
VRSVVRVYPGPPLSGSIALPPGGAIAQLGERLLCKQEVVGSIPSGSTNFFLRSGLRLVERTEPQRRLTRRSCQELNFCVAAQPRADIFYIVKRGSTWDFLQPQALTCLWRKPPTRVSSV